MVMPFKSARTSAVPAKQRELFYPPRHYCFWNMLRLASEDSGNTGSFPDPGWLGNGDDHVDARPVKNVLDITCFVVHKDEALLNVVLMRHFMDICPEISPLPWYHLGCRRETTSRVSVVLGGC